MTDQQRRVLMRDGRLRERDDVVAAFRESTDDVWDRSRGAIVIEGRPGLGKTALINTCRLLAIDKGLTVLRTRCSEAEQHDSFAVARRLLAPRLEIGFEPDVADVLMLRALRGDPVPPDEVHKVLLGLTAFLARSSPVLVLVDDAHFADAESATWLQFLCRRLRTVDAHVVLSTTPRRPAAPLTAIDHLVADDSSRCFMLGALHESSVEAMVLDRFGEPIDAAFVTELHRVTGGNPFLVSSVLHHASEHPEARRALVLDELALPAVVRWVLALTSALPAPAFALAQAASVLGPRADVSIAAKLAEIDLELANELADALADLGVFRPGHPIDFEYPLVRSSIHGELAGSRHSVNHATAARLLADGDRPTEEIGRHLLEAEPGEQEWAVDSLTVAAIGALADGDLSTAAMYLDRADREMSKPSQAPDLLLVRADLEARLGQPDAIDHFCAAASLHPDPTRLLDVGRRVIEQFQGTPSIDRIVVALTSPNVAGSAPPGVRLEVELLAVCARADVRAACSLEALLLPADLVRDRHDAAVNLAARTITALGLAAAGRVAPGSAGSLGAVLVALDAYASADDLAVGEQIVASLDVASVTFLVRCGLHAHAHRLLRSAVDRAAASGVVARLAMLEVLAAESYAAQGLLADAARALSDARQHSFDGPPAMADRVTVAFSELHALQTGVAVVPEVAGEHLAEPLGRLSLAVGDHIAALGYFEREAADAADRGVANPAMSGWRCGAVAALIALDRTAEAAELAETNLELARAFGAPLPLAMALRGAARLAVGEDRLRLLGEALTVLEPTAAEIERCRVQVALGVALRATDAHASRDVLREAADATLRIGASGLVDRATDELRASGARPRRLLMSGFEALTPSELRTALLAAKGATNTEIADTLCVSVKTVESHLSRTYRKLRVTSRSELGDIVAP